MDIGRNSNSEANGQRQDGVNGARAEASDENRAEGGEMRQVEPQVLYHPFLNGEFYTHSIKRDMGKASPLV